MMSKVALARLGMNSEANPRDTQGTAYHKAYPESHQVKEVHLWPVVDNGKDYYVEKNGVKFAGTEDSCHPEKPVVELIWKREYRESLQRQL